MDDDYRVVTTGQILEGFDPNDVQERLVSVLRLQPAQAERFFEKPRVLKKGMSWAAADKLCGQLATLGIAAEIQNPPPSVPIEPAAPIQPLHEESALELVQDEAAEASPGKGNFACPSCGHMQVKSEQCESCGIWFHKFESTGIQSQPDLTPAAIPASTPAMQADDTRVISSDVVAEEGAINPVAIAAATIAALIGALVWKFAAVSLGYEFGLIAWGIGGAVGFAAGSTGSHGMKAGAVCAILAFGSIMLGKYWAYSEFIDEFQDEVSVEAGEEGEMYAFYLEEMEDARRFVRGSGTDIFTRRFMVERGYTYAINPADVTDEELADFREYVEPNLRDIAANQPSYEEWHADNEDVLVDISPWELMREDFGLLDIIFLLLGVGTAFRLGSGWD